MVDLDLVASPVSDLDRLPVVVYSPVYAHVCRMRRTSYYDSAVRVDQGRAILAEESIDWPFDKLLNHLEERYGKNRTWADVMPEARRLRRKPGQPLSQFYDEVLRLLATARIAPEHYQRLAFTTYLDGLNCNRIMLNEVLQSSSPGGTVDDLHRVCTDYEARHGLSCYEYSATAPMNMVGAADGLLQHMATQTQQPMPNAYYGQNSQAGQPNLPTSGSYVGYPMAPPTVPYQPSMPMQHPPQPLEQPYTVPAAEVLQPPPPDSGLVAAVYPQGGNYPTQYNNRSNGYRNYNNYPNRPPPRYEQAQ